MRVIQETWLSDDRQIVTLRDDTDEPVRVIVRTAKGIVLEEEPVGSYIEAHEKIEEFRKKLLVEKKG